MDHYGLQSMKKKIKKKLCPRPGSNQGTLFLVAPKPVRYLWATLLHIVYELIIYVNNPTSLITNGADLIDRNLFNKIMVEILFSLMSNLENCIIPIY